MIDTFMFCDLAQYELLARGTMRGIEVQPLISAIRQLPHDSVATIDLSEVSALDVVAAAALRVAIETRRLDGVEVTVVMPGHAATVATSIEQEVPCIEEGAIVEGSATSSMASCATSTTVTAAAAGASPATTWQPPLSIPSE